jgi:excisionase family DNA binding protein
VDAKSSPASTSEPACRAETLSVVEAAARLGRDRSRIYALVRSGELAAVRTDAGELRLDASSVERWAVASQDRQERGRLLVPRNAWALIGLGSGDQRLRDRCLGLLERADDAVRARARYSQHGLLKLAPRLRRRATATVVHLPVGLLAEVQHDSSLVRTGASAARACGWRELQDRGPWALDVYARPETVQALLARVAELASAAGSETASSASTRSILLRVVDGLDGLWPFHPTPSSHRRRWRRSTCSSTPTPWCAASASRCCASCPRRRPPQWRGAARGHAPWTSRTRAGC